MKTTTGLLVCALLSTASMTAIADDTLCPAKLQVTCKNQTCSINGGASYAPWKIEANSPRAADGTYTIVFSVASYNRLGTASCQYGLEQAPIPVIALSASRQVQPDTDASGQQWLGNRCAPYPMNPKLCPFKAS